MIRFENMVMIMWFIFGMSFSSCEKRIPLDTNFPLQEQLLFCEIFGIPNIGFKGVIMPIQKISDNQNAEFSEIKLSFFEDEKIVYSEFLSNSKIDIQYPVKRNFEYRIMIEFADQIISSPNKHSPPEIAIEDYQVENNFVDSLGLNVVQLSYGCHIDKSIDSIYYVNEDLIINPPFLGKTFGIPELPKLYLKGEKISIVKRIANPDSKKYIQSLVRTIDRDAFQYYKLSAQLGTIPNDKIDGHQGNLKGALGYFGVLDYDFELHEL